MFSLLPRCPGDEAGGNVVLAALGGDIPMRASSNSPSTRAASRGPSPGWPRWIPAAGWWQKDTPTGASNARDLLVKRGDELCQRHHRGRTGAGQLGLTAAQRAFRAFDRLVLALLIITPLVFAGALRASTRPPPRPATADRRRHARPDRGPARRDLVPHHGSPGTAIRPLPLGGRDPAVGRRAGQAIVHLGSALAGHVSGDATVTWVRRHLHLLRIGGAVTAALALLILSVNWIGLLIIAALLALYEYGLHRLRQPQPAAEPSAHQRPATARTSRPQPGCQRRRWHRLGPQAPVVGPAPKRRQGITGTHPAKAHGRIHPGRPEMIPGSGFTTGSGAFGPQETPGHPASAQPAERLRAKPGRPIPPSGWCC